jgi:hypothetical protein
MLYFLYNLTKGTNAMFDTFSRTFAPPQAVVCWVDDVAVYCAVPARSGPPLIQRYPLSEAGLSKALNILRKQNREAIRHGHRQPQPTPAKLKHAKREVPAEVRAEVQALLRKLA